MRVTFDPQMHLPTAPLTHIGPLATVLLDVRRTFNNLELLSLFDAVKSKMHAELFENRLVVRQGVKKVNRGTVDHGQPDIFNLFLLLLLALFHLFVPSVFVALALPANITRVLVIDTLLVCFEFRVSIRVEVHLVFVLKLVVGVDLIIRAIWVLFEHRRVVLVVVVFEGLCVRVIEVLNVFLDKDHHLSRLCCH